MLEIFSLEGKTAVVTGAAKGNGKALAEGLAEAGCTVLAFDILPKSSPHYTLELTNQRVKYFELDLTCSSAPQRVLEKIEASTKACHILVNNAGVTLGHLASEYPEELWDKTLLINLTTPFRLMKALYPLLAAQQSSSIINITSLGAHQGFGNNPAYVASKGGLAALTRGFAKDWAEENIRVNSICPGYIQTDMTQKSFSDQELHQQRLSRMLLPRWGQSTDLVGAAIFLASDASSYITGQSIPVDGGWLVAGV